MPVSEWLQQTQTHQAAVAQERMHTKTGPKQSVNRKLAFPIQLDRVSPLRLQPEI